MNAKKVFPNWVWAVYAILFSLSIPWYLPEGRSMQIALGLPLWLVLCISAIVVMAGFTIWIIGKFWK